MINREHVKLTTTDWRPKACRYSVGVGWVDSRNAANLTLENVDHPTASWHPAVLGVSDTVVVTAPMSACVPAADREDRTAFVRQILASAVGTLGSVSAVELRGSAFAGRTSPAWIMYRTTILKIKVFWHMTLCCWASGYKCFKGLSVSSSSGPNSSSWQWTEDSMILQNTGNHSNTARTTHIRKHESPAASLSEHHIYHNLKTCFTNKLS
jgi:hypothetical protein